MQKNSLFFKNIIFSLSLVVVLVMLSSCNGAAKREQQAKIQKQAEIYYKMGELKFSEGSFSVALKNLHKSVELNPRSTSTQNLLGLSYFAKRLYAEAEVHFKKALDIDQSFASARLNLGSLYLETSRWDMAIAEIDILLKDVFYVTPELLHNNKGWGLYNKGLYQDAIDSYNKAIDINSRYSVAYNNRGLAEEKIKRKKSARTSYKKALEITPLYVDASYNYGRLMININRKTARRLFTKVIELSPDSKMGKSSEEYLKLLRKKR